MRIRLCTPFIVFLLSFLAISPLWANESPLKVELILKGLSKSGNCIPILINSKPGQMCPNPDFNTIVKIQNVSKEDLYLSEWTCSYQESFMTDNKLVYPSSWTCHANAIMSFILKPKETHEWPLRLTVDGQEDVHFKVGYKAWRLLDSKNYSSKVLIEGGPFWSNDVVVHVPSK